MKIKEGDGMEDNKRKQFESEFVKTDYFDIEYRAKGISKPFSWNDRANRYVWHDIQAGWEMWEKAQAVPEGFVLMPKEPTEKMNKAGLQEYRKVIGVGQDDIGYIYKAMIEAQEPAK